MFDESALLKGQLSIRRGSYVVRRGRGRVYSRARPRVTSRRLPVGWFCKGSSRTMGSVPIARASGLDRAGLAVRTPMRSGVNLGNRTSWK